MTCSILGNGSVPPLAMGSLGCMMPFAMEKMTQTLEQVSFLTVSTVIKTLQPVPCLQAVSPFTVNAQLITWLDDVLAREKVTKTLEQLPRLAWLNTACRCALNPL